VGQEGITSDRYESSSISDTTEANISIDGTTVVIEQSFFTFSTNTLSIDYSVDGSLLSAGNSVKIELS